MRNTLSLAHSCCARRLQLAIVVWLQSLSAYAQAVTLVDVEGARIEVSSVVQEKIIRDGELVYPAPHVTGEITIGSDNTITQSFQSSAVVRGHQKNGNQVSGIFTLDKPKKTKKGDDVIGTFTNGNLVRLIVYGKEGNAGGQMMTISFTRSAKGVACNFSMPLAKENGTGEIRKDSSVDGTPIQILEFKQLSTSCQIVK